MKKTIWICTAALFLALSTGCSGSSPSASTPSASGAQTSVPPSASPSASPSPAASPSESSSPVPSESAGPSESPAPSPSTSPGNDLAGQVRSMSLEQKIGQMILAGVDGTNMDKSAAGMIQNDHVGGIILFKNNLSQGTAPAVKLINDLKRANSRNAAPLFMSVDQEGGRVSRLPASFEPMPANAVVGRTKNADLAEQMGVLIAESVQLLGFNVDFAPVLDINSNPKNPVIGDRSFGNAASLVTDMGLREMKGIRAGGVIPAVKHFPGHGDTSVDSHLDLPVVRKTEAELKKLEWIPFQAAIDEHAEAVMAAHILFPLIDPDAPASFSKIIIGDQLRGKLGYQGVVITDDLTMGAIANHYGIAEAAVRSVEAGSDILLVAHGYDTEHQVYRALLKAVHDGQIAESRIDESVIRILKLKRTYSLSDAPARTPTKSTIERLNAKIRDWLDKVNAK